MTHSTLGQDIAQVNARAKVQGRAQYAGDLKLPGMLHAKVLRSPYPHARIVRIDPSAARALPGVKAVLTGADAPRAMWGVSHKERRILADGVVRFAGEEVAAVAAISDEIARDALDLIEVEYEELPAILTPEEAMDEDAPGVHPARNNIAHEIRFERGDVQAGLAQAALVHEATYNTHAQYPGYLEPMATLASIDAEGRLLVQTSTQSVFLARGRLAAALERPVSSIRVVQATTGGGFGGKIIEDDNQLVAGLLALRTGRPVRLVNNRLEDFLACCSSLPERIWLKLGMTREGLIVAKDVRIVAECGAYAGLSGEVMHVSAMRSDNMHRLENVRSHATLVYTNNPPHGAFRGFGGTQMLFALNSHIHTMAERLGLDPVEVHKRNAVEAGDVSVHGWKIGSAGLKECIDQATDAIGWRDKRAQPRQARGPKRRGIGMAAAMHVSGNRTIGNWDGSTVVVRINEDGQALVLSGECDMGQGAMTMLTQVVAHELTLPLSRVRVAPPDTDSAPFAIGSLASRVTMAAGNAAIGAARAARDMLFALASTLLEVRVEDLEMADGAVRVRGTDRALGMAELARQHIWRHGGESIQVSHTWDAATQMHDDNVYGNIAPAYSFAAQAVEVEVDTETGQVTVLDSYVADDCGKALNPVAIHGQTNGATVQAIGWALYEQLQLEGGRLGNGNFADYTMPTADAVPMLRGGLVESNEPNGPYGAKGASETAILPGAPAIANAVDDAIGVRIHDLPITPEKILAALRARAQEAPMHDFDFLQPTSVAEASRMLADLGDDCRVIAGGTALMLGMRQRMLVPTHLVSLAGIDALRGIDFDPVHGLRIGALARHADVASSALVRQHYPVLASMAARVANPQVRNQGTFGGNLCYADPSTDPPGCLMALDAQVVLASARGERVLTIAQFLVDYYVTALASDEVVAEIRVPPMAQGRSGVYTRFLRTAAEHRPLVSVALVARREGTVCRDARLSVGASTPVPTRLPRAEAFLEGRAITPDVAAEAAEIVAADIAPVSDTRGSADFRRDMVRVVARRTVAELFGLDIEQGATA